MCVMMIVSECFNRITSPLTPTFFCWLFQEFKCVYVLTLCLEVLRNSDTELHLSEPPSSKILVAYQFHILFQAPFAYF